MKLFLILLTLTGCATRPDFSQMSQEQIDEYYANQARNAAAWQGFAYGLQQASQRNYQDSGHSYLNPQRTNCSHDTYGNLHCQSY